MHYLWNKEYLETHRIESTNFSVNDISKQIEVLEKILFYAPKLESVFEEKDIDFTTEKIEKDFRTEISISAALIVKNEERCILRCLTSILNEVDEIIVVDTGSTDCTIDLIKNIKNDKIKLYHREWTDDFSEARNYALDKVTAEWVFFIDADEFLDIHNLTLKDYFSTFNDFPYIDNTIFCPKIVDDNGNVSVGVQRAFRKDSRIRFYGKVHEEPRKYKNGIREELYPISLDLPLKHDGYTETVMESKDKLNKYLSLDKYMIKEEPENLRWIYFYLRDGNDVLSYEEYKKYITNFLLINPNEDIEISNLKDHEYTYDFLALYALKNFVYCDYNETIRLSEMMNEIKPGNGDSIYLKIYSQILLMKTQELDLLNSLISYRSANMDSQYGMLHSEGIHIDMLIGYLLFELGYIEKAMAYFDLTKNISDKDLLIQQCKNKIEQIIKLQMR